MHLLSEQLLDELVLCHSKELLAAYQSNMKARSPFIRPTQHHQGENVTSISRSPIVRVRSLACSCGTRTTALMVG